MNLVYTLA